MDTRKLIGVAAVALAALALWPRRASAFALPVLSRRSGADGMDLVRSTIERHEGRVPYVYKDQAGHDTFGIGHRLTSADAGLRQYTRSNPAPAAVVDALFAQDVARFVAVVDGLRLPLTASQRAALVSLAFNIGSGSFTASTLAAKLRSGDWRGAADQFAAWSKITDPKTGAKVSSAGLARRRADERALFLA
ncbi:MAG: hypothetical protein C0434_17705 [Xanthomonadaceae bacterium]|nr:hypothetical protein [Xanthomonadaceae bacterium]